MNKEYYICNSKIKKDITILLISDLHYTSKKDIKKYDFILETIKLENPNYLCIAGDLLDRADAKEQNLIIDFINKCAMYAKVIIGIGNHDVTCYTKRPIYNKNKQFWNQISKLKNVVVIDNNTYEIDNICFIGLTLPFSYYYIKGEDPEFLLSYLQSKNYCFNNSDNMNILIVHSSISLFHPSIRDKIDFLEDIDLVLSGHTHNGMVPKMLEPFFKNSGIISPFKKFHPKLVRGKFKYRNTDVIVSGGITKLSKKSKLDIFDRFWTREITKIVIQKNSV